MDESIFNKEEYLSKVIKELNNKCETNKKDYCHFYEWEMDFIDLKFDECRSYCYINFDNEYGHQKTLCKSCKRNFRNQNKKTI